MAIVAPVPEGGQPRGHGREGVGFGGQAAAVRVCIQPHDFVGVPCRASELSAAPRLVLRLNANPYQSGAAARSRRGESMSASRPKAARCAGIGWPRASAAQASPIAGEVWMP